MLLNELRARTGILLAVTTASTAFLGAAAVDHGGLHGWGVLALAAFAGAVGLGIAVLWPTRKWTFYESSTKAMTNYGPDAVHPDTNERWTVAQAQGDLALHMQRHARAAADQMKGMQSLFTGAAACLVGEIAFWLIEYGT